MSSPTEGPGTTGIGRGPASDAGGDEGARRSAAHPDPAVDPEAVLAALSTIVDPEIGLDVVTVGLIYGVEETDPGQITVRYTLTTRACPLGDFLERGMRAAASRVDGVTDVRMERVWHPPWTPERMEEAP